jgi:hypothetical protein
MPLVRIDLRKGKQAAYREAISRIVHEALVSVGVPKDDCFQVINEPDSENFVFDLNYLDIHRTEDLVIIQITWNEGRTSGRSGRPTASPPALIDNSRTGASMPHPSVDAGGAVAASALTPSAISVPRHVGAASAFGVGGGAGAISGAPSSGGRGGGNGGSSAIAFADAVNKRASASRSRRPARIACTAMNTSRMGQAGFK